jgi:hypothetical protein
MEQIKKRDLLGTLANYTIAIKEWAESRLVGTDRIDILSQSSSSAATMPRSISIRPLQKG